MDRWSKPISLLVVFFLTRTTISVSATQRPHVIFVVADDLGWADASFHGLLQIPTPNIDALASSGIILNNYYVSPICSPSRSAILTGMHPIHTGLQHYVLGANEPNALPLNFKLLPEYLKDLGYDTHAVGKWHLGFYKKEFTPTFRGFDSHFGYWTGKEDYFDHTALESYQYNGSNYMAWGLDFHDGMNPVKNQTGVYATDIFTDKAIDILKNHDKSKPLFLYLAHLAVHAGNTHKPLQVPPQYIDRFPHIKDKRRRTYAGMVSALDDAIGRLFQSLHDNGYLDNVVLVLTTDNGGAAGGIDNSEGCNWPLRGTKYTYWEGGVRGTALIWSPLLPRGVVANQMMHTTDWLPTLYAAIGENADTLNLDGLSLWKSLQQNSTSPRNEILHNIDPIWNMSALRIGDYKVVQGTFSNGNFDSWYKPAGLEDEIQMDISCQSSQVSTILEKMNLALPCVSSAPVKVSCGPRPVNASANCKPLESPCLYNVVEDPCEYNNIAKQEPQILSRLLHRLQEYNHTAVPPLVKSAVRISDPTFHDYQWVPYLDDSVTISSTRTSFVHN